MKKNQMNRRQFLGLTGSAGLFTLAGCAGPTSVGPNGLLQGPSPRAGWEVAGF